MDPLAPYFSQLLKDSNMIDVPPICAGPTWRNGRVGDEGISKRLDMLLASASLIPHLKMHRVWSHPSEVSDHYPVCME